MEEGEKDVNFVMRKLIGLRGKVKDVKRVECANEFGPINKEC